eukprot:TRINITY_DN20784_c0_g1_i1.p1 TRINITY_DN20784_c0_g1~~TRINITY_DN20784_c0_g1_i1.p1  ORF type:complete len:648 (+),score=27.72 TRINITY_DN20784_c0_g1_i1:43-1944(+)
MPSREKHNWVATHFKQPTWCKYCNKYIFGVGKQGLLCPECTTTIHSRCRDRVRFSARHKDCNKRRPLAFTTTNQELLELFPTHNLLIMTVPGSPKNDVWDCLTLNHNKFSKARNSVALRSDSTAKMLQFDSVKDKEMFVSNLSLLKSGLPPSKAELGWKQEDCTIFMTTFNMANNPPPLDIGEWIPAHSGFGLIVIAVQECEYYTQLAQYDDMGQNTVMRGANTVSADEHFFDKISDHLKSHYRKVQTESHGGIRLGVWAAKAHREKIFEVETMKESLSAFGAVGSSMRDLTGDVNSTKGAVAMRITFHETVLCFISCQLTTGAGKEKVLARNEDIETICESFEELAWSGFNICKCFDYLFWMGDLNYRVQMDPVSAQQMMDAGDWPEMLEHDQLTREMDTRKAFLGFEALEPHFPPTYKFQIGSHYYSVKKRKVPSWCDRILYAAAPGMNVSVLSHRSVAKVTTSDHAPVIAEVKIPIRQQYIFSNPTTEANPKHFQACNRSCKFIISALAASSIVVGDLAGKSDPYITFHAAWLEKPEKTSVVKSTLNPTWRPHQIPELFPWTSEKAYLERHPLNLRVVDADNFNEDDELGQASVLLEGLIDDDQHEFEAEIIHNGTYGGEIIGTIQFIWL